MADKNEAKSPKKEDTPKQDEGVFQMSKKEKAESSGAQKLTDTREFPTEELGLDLDYSLTINKDDVMTLLRKYPEEMFIFFIRLRGTKKYNERDRTIKKLNMPEITGTFPDMYLVRISSTEDQQQKIEIVIKKIENDLEKNCEPEAVHIMVVDNLRYLDGQFVNYEHRYCKDERKVKGRRDDDAAGAGGAISVEEGLAKLTLVGAEGDKHTKPSKK